MKHFYCAPLYGIRSFYVSFHHFSQCFCIRQMTTKASNGYRQVCQVMENYVKLLNCSVDKWDTESVRTSFTQFGLKKRLNVLYFKQYSCFTSICLNFVFRLLILVFLFQSLLPFFRGSQRVLTLFTMDKFEFLSPFLSGEAEVERLQQSRNIIFTETDL